MTLKIDTMYYSEKLKTNIFLYKHDMALECDECGKICNNPWCFTREDDEEGLEYVVGNDCIKKYKLITIK